MLRTGNGQGECKGYPCLPGDEACRWRFNSTDCAALGCCADPTLYATRSNGWCYPDPNNQTSAAAGGGNGVGPGTCACAAGVGDGCGCGCTGGGQGGKPEGPCRPGCGCGHPCQPGWYPCVISCSWFACTLASR